MSAVKTDSNQVSYDDQLEMSSMFFKVPVRLDLSVVIKQKHLLLQREFQNKKRKILPEKFLPGYDPRP